MGDKLNRKVGKIEAINYQKRSQKRVAIIEKGVAKIPLGLNAKDGFVIVDIEFAKLDSHYWYLDNVGYARTTIKGKGTRLHQLVVGKAPRGFVIDHKDQNKLNNKSSNLRYLKHGANLINSDVWRHNTSGYKGVSWDKQRSKWVMTLGKTWKRFDTLEEAIKARKVAEEKKYGLHLHI